jgi:cytochrome c oxidase assembly factor CtaG
MTAWQILTLTWDWEPSVISGCFGLLLTYLALVRFRRSAQTAAFAAGVVVLLLALLSPLDTIGETYLFSVHMLQHLLLVLIVPPLLLLGLPAAGVRAFLRWPPAARLERVLGQPVVAWLLGTGAVWLWHLPALYNAALADLPLHIVQHLSFLITATIFWWPILAPAGVRRLDLLGTMAYLFAAAAASSILGIILTFAAPGLYPAYLHPFDRFAILDKLRRDWGMTPAMDQQIGGLIMWVPGSLVYLIGILGALGRWFQTPDDDEAPAPPAMPTRVPVPVGGSLEET